jgi:hypothetical protein
VVAANTADDLLVRVKARASIPATEGRLSDPDILAIADDATRSTVARVLYNSDDGRWVKTQADVALVVDQSAYRLPERAMGGSVRIKYRRTPSKLVAISFCASITSLSATVLQAVTTPGVLSGTWSSPTTIDIVEGTPQGDALEDDIAATFTATEITRSSGAFATSGPNMVAGGDYACIAGTTCVPQIPAAVFPFLVALTTYETLIALGDAQGAADLVPIVELRKREAKALTAERNRERVVVINHDGHLRSGRTRYVYGGG